MPGEFGTPQINEMVYVRQILQDIKKTVTDHKKEVEIKLSKLNNDVGHIRSSVDRLGVDRMVGDIKELKDKDSCLGRRTTKLESCYNKMLGIVGFLGFILIVIGAAKVFLVP